MILASTVFEILVAKRPKIANLPTVTLKAGSAVTQGHCDFGTNGKRVYIFLLVINSNFSPILHRFGDMAA